MSDNVTVPAPVVTSDEYTDQITHDINKPMMINEANFKAQEKHISMAVTQGTSTNVTISYS